MDQASHLRAQWLPIRSPLHTHTETQKLELEIGPKADVGGLKMARLPFGFPFKYQPGARNPFEKLLCLPTSVEKRELSGRFAHSMAEFWSDKSQASRPPPPPTNAKAASFASYV